jgi:hypothetical protein
LGSLWPLNLIMQKTFKAISLFVFVGILAALSPAPHIHHDKGFIPRTTESKLEHDQAFNKTIPVVGDVDLSPKQVPQAANPTDDNAAMAVAGGQKMESANQHQAAEDIRTAGVVLQNSRGGPLKSLLWVIIAGCFGYGAFFAFRRWADKAIPESNTGYDES